MPGIFGDQDRGHHRLGRQPALDQPFGRWGLDHGLFAGPAGVLGTMRHDHPVLGRDHVESLGGVLPDDVHHAMTAWADGTLGREYDVDAGKMGRQRSAVGATLLPLGIGRLFRRFLLVLLRVLLGDRRLDIFQHQLHLIGIKPFGPPAKLRALELPQEVVKPIILIRHSPAFLNGRVALARQGAHQRPQGVELIGKCVGRHADTESDSRTLVMPNTQS
jgi:hypothetical protein